MNKQDLDILNILYLEPYVNQRNLAEKAGYSLGAVNKSLKALEQDGLIDASHCLTGKAADLIEKNRPRNAVILAAGFGMRMVPINLETPKALIEVNGERLIDRLIRQLQEAGVTDITVVVGFMKDSFEYLIDEFGAELLYNDQYAVKNNIVSLALAAERLSNTYIVPCDIWCADNPFRRSELYSWYMVSDEADPRSGVRANRRTELVCTKAGETGNSMLGLAYLTADAAPGVKDRLFRFTSDSRHDQSFWEDALYEGHKMILPARIVHAEDVVEINTYEQLRSLDADSDHLASDAISVIAEQFTCDPHDITNIEVLKKGMTNRSFLFTVNGGKYIMRIPGEGTDQLINRDQEAAVYAAISGRDLCDDPVYLNPANGYKITRYISDVRCCDPQNDDDVSRCVGKMKRFHDMKLTVPHTFDIFGKIEQYESFWDGSPSIYRDYETTKANVLSLRAFVESQRGEMYLTHIDAVPDNFLFDPSVAGELEIQLTDWEYASMQDQHVDIAMFAIYSMYSKRQVDKLIDLYFADTGGCDTMTRAKIYCYIAMCGLLWSNWCEYKRNLGVEFGTYSLYQYRYAKEYYRYAVRLIKEG